MSWEKEGEEAGPECQQESILQRLRDCDVTPFSFHVYLSLNTDLRPASSMMILWVEEWNAEWNLDGVVECCIILYITFSPDMEETHITDVLTWWARRESKKGCCWYLLFSLLKAFSSCIMLVILWMTLSILHSIWLSSWSSCCRNSSPIRLFDLKTCKANVTHVREQEDFARMKEVNERKTSLRGRRKGRRKTSVKSSVGVIRHPLVLLADLLWFSQRLSIQGLSLRSCEFSTL